MKRLYSLFLVLALSISASAYDFSALDANGNTIYYNILGGDSVEVTYKNSSYYEYISEVIIPANVTNGENVYRVSKIGDGAFADNRLPSVIIEDGVIEIGNYAFDHCSLKSVKLPNTLRTIGDAAFFVSGLEHIVIPQDIIYIGPNAFYECDQLKWVECDATIPPDIFEYTFSAGYDTIYTPDPTREAKPVSKLYVKQDYVMDYTYSSWANQFETIIGLTTFGESEVIDITATTAIIKWIPDPDVIEYTISVYTSGNLFRQYIVDMNGNLKNMHNALARIPQIKMDTTYSTDDYFVVSMEDLTSNTDYNYIINGTNAEYQQIYYEEGGFRTNNSEELIDAIFIDPKKPRKILHNGQIYILKGDELYTLQGQKINPLQ